MAKRIVHLTSAHHPLDNRIFEKECCSLVKAGYEVSLIASWPESFTRSGVNIIGVPPARSRFTRMAWMPFRILRTALRTKAKVFHFHDPELIPVGLLLRILGKKVIYDIHEDYQSSIQQKTYLPFFVRRPLSKFFRLLELLSSRFFTKLIIAERYYSRIFPQAVPVLNYPVDSYFPRPTPKSSKAQNFIYTGNVTEDRGAFEHVRLLNLFPDCELHLIGKCAASLAERMKERAHDPSHLKFYGIDEHINFEKIASSYATQNWIGALAIFPPTPHYMEKELTKLFEYMAAGIPIICSNFPTWKRLVENSGAGICVDPTAIEKSREEILRIKTDDVLRARLAQAGRKHFETTYSWLSQEKRLNQLYEHIGA